MAPKLHVALLLVGYLQQIVCIHRPDSAVSMSRKNDSLVSAHTNTSTRGRVNSFVPQSFLFYFWHMFYHSCQGRKHINLVLIAAHLNIFTGRENCSVLLDFFCCAQTRRYCTFALKGNGQFFQQEFEATNVSMRS